MITEAKSGHPGGSLSIAEIIVTLYFDVLRHDPSNPKWKDRDRFVLSKGHCCPILYAVMAECGYCPKETLNTLRKLGSIYQGHPDVRFFPRARSINRLAGTGPVSGPGHGPRGQARWQPVPLLRRAGRWRDSRRPDLGSRDVRLLPQGRQCRRDRRLQSHPAGRLRQGHHGPGAAGRQVAQLRLARDRSRRPQRHRIAERFRGGCGDEGQAGMYCRPHGQGQGRLFHGEQSQIPRFCSHAGGV